MIESIVLLLIGFFGLRKSWYSKNSSTSDEGSSCFETFRIKTKQVFNILFIENFTHPLEGKIPPSRYPSISTFSSFTLLTRQYAMFVLAFIFIVLMPIYAALGVYYHLQSTLCLDDFTCISLWYESYNYINDLLRVIHHFRGCIDSYIV